MEGARTARFSTPSRGKMPRAGSDSDSDVATSGGSSESSSESSSEGSDTDSADDSANVSTDDSDASSDPDELDDPDHDQGRVRCTIQATTAFTAIKTGDLTFVPGDRFRVVGDADDEGWLCVESLADTTVTGQVPASYMAEVAPEPAIKLDKKALRAKNAASVIGQLAASGLVPSGHRLSTLAQAEDDRANQLPFAMTPKLAPSGLRFRDISLGADNQIHRRTVALCKIATVLEAVCVPMPQDCAEVTVLEKQARLVLFDGERYRSNIQTIRSPGASTAAKKDPNVLAGTTWDFGKGADFPGGEADDNACLLRYDGDLESTRLLIELAYVAKLGSGIDVTISCGWTQVPLNSGSDGSSSSSSSMAWDMYLHGGTPFETGVAIASLEPDAAIRTKSTGSRRRRRTANTNPKLRLKVDSVGGNASKLADELPDTLLCQETFIPLFSMYRQGLADSLLVLGHGSLRGTANPQAANFLIACEDMLILRAIRAAWASHFKALPRKARKDLQLAKTLFAKLLVGNGARALYATTPDNHATDTGRAPDHALVRKGSVAGTAVPKRRSSAVAITTKSGVERKRYAKLLRLFKEPIVNSRQSKTETYKPFSTAELRVDLF